MSAGSDRVFISYRREGGAEMARLVRDALRQRGYDVFMDVEDLRHGPFNTALLREIESCSDVVVILTPQSLDRCHDQDDWLGREIAHAIRQQRNIVPVMTRGFTWPDSLPDEIATISSFNGLSPSHDYFDATISKLTELLLAIPRSKHIATTLVHAVLSVIACGGLAMAVIVLYGTLLRTGSTDNAIPPAAHGELTTSDGRILFCTERFEPTAQVATLHGAGSAAQRPEKVFSLSLMDTADEIELAFQIRNDTDDIVTLSALRVLQLGRTAVFEDTATLVSESYMIMNVDEERTVLGSLELSLGDAPGGERTSGNLLSTDRLETVPPRTARSFLVRLRYKAERVAETIFTTSTDRVYARPRGGAKVADTAYFGITATLDSLDAEPPTEEWLGDLYVAAVDLVCSGGQATTLYSDRVYCLCPESVENASLPQLGEQSSYYPIRSWHSPSPEELVSFLLGHAVKVYSETKVYRVAKDEGVIPPDFDAGTVSTYCYYGDAGSPFRQSTKESVMRDRSDGTNVASADGPFRRSNVVSVLARIAAMHPIVWRAIEAELGQIALRKDTILSQKAHYVLSELGSAEQRRAFATETGVGDSANVPSQP